MLFHRASTPRGTTVARSERRSARAVVGRAHGYARTHVGIVRDSNEDAYIVNDRLGLYAVCDGMGGHQAGEVASAAAVSAIEAIVERHREAVGRSSLRRADGERHLENTAYAAVRQGAINVCRRALGEPSLQGMGTTATVLLVGRRCGAMAHVGDSRLYQIRGHNAVQVSSDHTVPAELVRDGMLSPDDAALHPDRHLLTRSVGPQMPSEIDTCLFDVQPGDRLILCSDGLSDLLPTSPRWLADQSSRFSAPDFVDALVDYALAAGGHDNVTVVAVDIGAERRWPNPKPAFERLGPRSVTVPSLISQAV